MHRAGCEVIVLVCLLPELSRYCAAATAAAAAERFTHDHLVGTAAFYFGLLRQKTCAEKLGRNCHTRFFMPLSLVDDYPAKTAVAARCTKGSKRERPSTALGQGRESLLDCHRMLENGHTQLGFNPSCRV